MKLWFRVFFILSFQTHVAKADIQIPTNLSAEDQRKVVQVLGFSSAIKFLGDPFPLGGYSGFEFGVSMEFIPTSEIATLGNKASPQPELSYMSLAMGKGLYNNMDVFVHVSPFRQAENITSYGGMLRWSFFQAEYVPAYLSLALSVNSVNFQNKIVMTNQSSDLVAGFNVQDLTLYAGGGVIGSAGIFMGGAGGVTSSGGETNVRMSEIHYLAGVSIKKRNFFMAFQIDRYLEATYSAKLGFRL